MKVMLLRLYPRWWRRRYEDEVREILHHRRMTPATVADLLGGALDAWMNQELPPSASDERDSPIVEPGFHIPGNRAWLAGTSRIGVAASLAVLGCECIACFAAGSLEWSDRAQMAGIDSSEAAEQARFAVELCAIGGLNLVAGVGLLLRRSPWSWWLVLGIQVGLTALALIQGVVTDLGWFFFSGVPVVTLLLLFALRHARPLAPTQLASSGW